MYVVRTGFSQALQDAWEEMWSVLASTLATYLSASEIIRE